MKHRQILGCAFIAVVLFASAPMAIGQARSGSANSHFWAGLNLGYLTRALALNDEEPDTIPKMTSLMASLVLGYEFQPGFTLNVQVGYSSSKFDNLTFRHLPYSLEMNTESGGLGGILFGTEVEKSIFGGAAFGVDLRGQFIASFGLSKKWKLQGLAVDGSADGKPVWMNASVGPLLTYRGWKGVTPFLCPRFDYLWGSFEFKETIQELTGSEKKDIKGKGRFSLGMGADFELSSSLRFRGEAGFYPRSGGTDFSFTIQTLVAF